MNQFKNLKHLKIEKSGDRKVEELKNFRETEKWENLKTNYLIEKLRNRKTENLETSKFEKLKSGKIEIMKSRKIEKS